MRKPTKKEAELLGLARLKQEKAELDALFLSIGEGVIVTEIHGNISRINDTALQLIGYKKKELLGKWYPEVIVAEDEDGFVVPNIERPITEVFLTGKPVFRKLIYRRKDGSKVTVAVTVSPVLLGGNPIGAIELLRDITAEVELERTKDEFISIASHELRTPATIVKQYISMVLSGYTGPINRDQQKMLRTAYDNNERQLIIINDLLNVAHAEADEIKIEKKKIDLVPLLSGIVSEQAEKFKKLHHTVSFPHGSQPIYFETDPNHIQMMVENILSNAHKYTPENKSIELTLRENDAEIEIKVRDTGVGIQDSDISKLFLKFSRIDNPLALEAGGSGLGLFWVKKLVILHGGTIDVVSKVGKGTAFTITLPKRY